ncbi:hypothetical protein AAG570_013858 [Ranatra chinensis]|uniref:Uncharacterized protein n=1 Tax=Ranatra chinensis TaxID=642074 RepID=A0ABD0Z1M7_9HEMI
MAIRRNRFGPTDSDQETTDHGREVPGVVPGRWAYCGRVIPWTRPSHDTQGANNAGDGTPGEERQPHHHTTAPDRDRPLNGRPRRPPPHHRHTPTTAIRPG